MAYLTGRRLSREAMDDPNADRAELAASLKYLRWVNQTLGGANAAIAALEHSARDWPKDRAIRLLDVGTGSADIPLAIADWAKRRGHCINITAIDVHPTTVELARQHVGWRDDIALMHADALRLTDIFEAGEFDYAHAGLFLHHLEDVQVITVLRMMDRLTTRGVIWNDLLRGWPGKFGVRLLTLGSRVPKMVKHDAIVSVDAGFTRREALDMAHRAGLKRVTLRSYLFYRFTLVNGK
jgi:ubiquinone/menaquinone biosynthesis C-methylase UbiE